MSWMSSRKAKLGALALAVLVTLTVFIFSSKKTASPPAPTGAIDETRATPWLDGDFIRYTKTFADREKLALVEVAEAPLTPEVTVNGVVTYDARRVAAVGARISGRVQALHHVEGEDVKAGEVMAEVSSAQLGQAQADVLKARAREQVAKLDEQRERRLADAKVTAERDAEHAKVAAQASTYERIAAEKSVEALGGSMSGETGVLFLKSPIAGEIVEMHVKRGETVEPTDTLFVVADLSRVWVELSVFENTIDLVREGDSVEIFRPGASEGVSGVVEHVPSVLDPEHRNVQVRVALANTSRLLKPGMSVQAKIAITGSSAPKLVVPRDAVTRIDGKPTVFVAVDQGRVEPRPVHLGPHDARTVAIESGVTKGERVVVGGVLALKAEVFR